MNENPLARLDTYCIGDVIQTQVLIKDLIAVAKMQAQQYFTTEEEALRELHEVIDLFWPQVEIKYSPKEGLQ